MTIQQAIELRNRISRDGWVWTGEPRLNGGRWEFPLRFAGEQIENQALARDRQIGTEAEAQQFIRDIEQSIGMARLNNL